MESVRSEGQDGDKIKCVTAYPQLRQGFVKEQRGLFQNKANVFVVSLEDGHDPSASYNKHVCLYWKGPNTLY